MLKFPHFHRNEAENERVAWELQTARYDPDAMDSRLRFAAVSTLRSSSRWRAALGSHNTEGSDQARRKWRNGHLARWVGLPGTASG